MCSLPSISPTNELRKHDQEKTPNDDIQHGRLMVVQNKTRYCYSIVCWDNRLLGPRLTGLHRFISDWYESRNAHGGYHPRLVLYDLLSHWNPLCLSLYFNPLEIPPTNLLEISWAIGTSNHTAELVQQNRGTVHGGPKVMKDQVLMDPEVCQLKDASLQHCLESCHVQQGRAKCDPSLVTRRSARRVFHLLLHLRAGRSCDESNTSVHSLLNQESKHEVAGRE